MFGGRSASLSPLGDTWTWNGAAWSQAALGGPSPSPRYSPAIARFSRDGMTYMFGGVGASGWLSDFWRWDGFSWSSVPISGGLPPMIGQLADCRGNGSLLLVGYNSVGGIEAWGWDGAAWSVKPAPPVSGSSSYCLIDEPMSGRCLLLGGQGGTWDWDGVQWKGLGSSLGLWTVRAQSVAPSSGGKCLLLGPQPSLCCGDNGNATFQFDWNHNGYVVGMGQGCAGQFGVPNVTTFLNQPVVAGSSAAFSVNAVSPGGLSWFVVSFDRYSWLGQALPLDLGFLGVPGCVAYVRPDFTSVAVASPLGAATCSVTFPLSLAAARLYVQAISLDSTRPGGMVTSGALELQLGF